MEGFLSKLKEESRKLIFVKEVMKVKDLLKKWN